MKQLIIEMRLPTEVIFKNKIFPLIKASCGLKTSEKMKSNEREVKSSGIRLVLSRHHDASLDLPDGTKKTTRPEKYFPRIAPQYDARSRTYAAALAWNF